MLFLIISLYDFCRIATYNTVRRHILCHHCICGYYRSITNSDTREYCCLVAYPHVIANYHRALRCYRSFRGLHFQRCPIGLTMRVVGNGDPLSRQQTVTYCNLIGTCYMVISPKITIVADGKIWLSITYPPQAVKYKSLPKEELLPM